MVEEQAGAIVITDDRRALVLYSESGRWSFPKGHIEAGESPVSTAARELFEETSIKGIPQAYITRFSFQHKQRDYDLRLYRVAYVSGEPLDHVHANTKACWISIDDIDHHVAYHPVYRDALLSASKSMCPLLDLASVQDADVQAAELILGSPVKLIPLSESYASRPLYRLEGKQLMIRRYENEAESRRIEDILKRGKSLPIPQFVGRHRHWVLTTYLSGKPVLAQEKNNILNLAGQLLASFHSLPLTSIETSEAKHQVLANIDDQWRRSMEMLRYTGLISSIQADKIEDLYAGSIPKQLELGFVHWDYVLNNLLYTEDETLALIDFESSRLFALGYDLSKSVALICSSPSEVEEFLRGYASVRPLDNWYNNRLFFDLFFSVRNLANRTKRPQFNFDDALRRLLTLTNKES